MNKKTSLSSLLKTFGSVLWYAASGDDFSVLDVFSKEKLGRFLNGSSCPDCFLLTDYDVSFRESMFIIKGTEYGGCDQKIIYSSDDCTVTAFNPCRIRSVNVGYDPDMVLGFSDGRLPRRYGCVYAADILIEYGNGNKYVSKLIYAVVENTRFIYDYLLKHRIKIKYLVRANYGYGFGGGLSTGMILINLIKDLGVEYFANDLNIASDDVADRYLTDSQRSSMPVLSQIANLTGIYGFAGYGDVMLYHVDGYEENGDRQAVIEQSREPDRYGSPSGVYPGER